MDNEINLDIDINTQPPTKEPSRQYYYIAKCREHIWELAAKYSRKVNYCVTTFGCQMNAHDSEKLKGILDRMGCEETEDEAADIVIYNTCTVRENANQKLYGHLGHLKNLKAKNPGMVICLCGCMMQEPHVIELIKEKYKFVDIVFGTHNIYKLAELLHTYFTTGRQTIEILGQSSETVEALPQKMKYGFKSGVNIMYGCNNFCTYCIVPYVRGRERSRKSEDITAEIKRLADAGVKEVMLLGQNVNSYGKIYDYSGGRMIQLPDEETVTFPKLLKMVCGIPGIERIRFMTSHPKDLSDELITVMASEEKICKHIHLPVQAGSSRILEKMNRRYTKEHYLTLVDKIRSAIPDISITTDIMVGFPDETEEDFAETMDLVERVRYDQAFTFIYSKRTGTPAASMEHQIDADVVKKRFNRLLERVNIIAGEQLRRYEGQTKDVLVEDINAQDDTFVTGRTGENVTVHFKGSKDLIGQTVRVHLKECKGFYFIGAEL
ncbi:MAG: tRNA (N6-isopentenyl adenosine(37)-C2)-methylthiotransferase MiaB [Clostridium sp.]|nr:tRNA (N6-isopentenyl adenosine(37)-C2)-methylthiotransferase MiaB [Clostridium sp.]